jgi:TRAP-type C4-dicarboxylate transport system permease small subunit
MKRIIKILENLINIVLAVSLAIMTVLVFGNVIFRYGFHSGITWSEELSRFLFIWLVFLGAIPTLKEGTHIGIDLISDKLSVVPRLIIGVIVHSIILLTSIMVLLGSWKMSIDSLESYAPATGISYFYVYGIGVIMSIGMILISISSIYKFIKLKDTREE